MTREEKIEQLQDWVEKNNLPNLDDLKLEISCCEFDIDEWEDVLHPIEWNCCDRCQDLYESEHLFWSGYDGFSDNENLMKGIESEVGEYITLCSKCVRELIEKGKEAK